MKHLKVTQQVANPVWQDTMLLDSDWLWGLKTRQTEGSVFSFGNKYALKHWITSSRFVSILFLLVLGSVENYLVKMMQK